MADTNPPSSAKGATPSTTTTTTTTPTPTPTGNPLKDDEELRRLLKDLEAIDSKREFGRWKASFLEKMQGYVTEEYRQAAEARYQSFAASMGKLSKVVKTLYLHLQQGHLSKENTTVKARRCLSELKEQIEQVMAEINTMLPRTKEEEKKVGYSKFHLGAVLVQDGFVEYDRLCICDEIMQHMKAHVFGGADDANDENDDNAGSGNDGAVALDRQILDNMGQFHHRINIFCDVMADLGLYKAMVKCRELMKLDDDKEPEAAASKEKDEDKVNAQNPPTEAAPATVHAPDPPPSSPRKSKKGDGFRFNVTTPSGASKKTNAEDTTGAAPNSSASTADDDSKTEKPEKATFNKFGHYYHGNSEDWRIAASLRNKSKGAEQVAQGKGAASKVKEKDAKAPPKADRQQHPESFEESKKPAVPSDGKGAATVESTKQDNRTPHQITGNQSTAKDESLSTGKGQEPPLAGPRDAENSTPAELANNATSDAQRANGKQSPKQQADKTTGDTKRGDDEETEGAWTSSSAVPKEWESVLGRLDADGCPKTFRGMADADLSGSVHSSPKSSTQSRSLLSGNSDHQDNQKEVALPEKDKETEPKKNGKEQEPPKRRADRHQSLPNVPFGKVSASPVKRGSQSANTTAAPSPLVGARQKLKSTSSRASASKSSAAVPQMKEALRTPPGTPTKGKVRKVDSPSSKKTKKAATESSPTRSPKGRVKKGAPPLHPPPLTSEPMGENFGYAVSISSEGTIMAAGSPRYGKNSKGRARVFGVDDDSGEWTQIGQDLIGKAENDTFGAAVSLSADGQIVAVGSPQWDTEKAGYVRVYQYYEDDNYWASLGRPIEGMEPHECFGWAVSLSSNGRRLVVGGPQSAKQDGVVRIYKYDSESRQWTQLGSDIRGDAFGVSVATTASGHVAASGSARQGDMENAHAFPVP